MKMDGEKNGKNVKKEKNIIMSSFYPKNFQGKMMK